VSLTTPILNKIQTFSANNLYKVTFNVIGGNQITKYNIEIQKNLDSISVYNQTVESFIYEHIIPANTLTNGIQYKARIRTGDVSTNWSEWSSWVVFSCVDIPIVTIPTIANGTVNNQTVIFQGLYVHEYDILQSYRYVLYNQDKTAIQSFDEKFDENLSQEVAGLQNGQTYYIELITISLLGMSGTSGLIQFSANYIAPKISSIVSLINEYDSGRIKIIGNVNQIIFKTENENQPTYIDNNIIDLKNQMIYLDNVNFVNDFSIKIYCKISDKFHLKNDCENISDFFTSINFNIPKASSIEFLDPKNGTGYYKMIINQNIYDIPQSTRSGIVFNNVGIGNYLISAFIKGNKPIKLYTYDGSTTYTQLNSDILKWGKVGFKYSNLSKKNINVGLEMNLNDFPFLSNDYACIDAISIFPINDDEFQNLSVYSLLEKYNYNSIPHTSTIFILEFSYGTFELKYFDNKFHIYKKINNQNIEHHIMSNEISLNSDDNVEILLQQINNYANIVVRKL
jgi:hypothetical protein